LVDAVMMFMKRNIPSVADLRAMDAIRDSDSGTDVLQRNARTI
jgi:hypothetical protein